ncbi:glycosyl transferase group 1 [Methyloglobulus morosus KoM1]|uniref:Glycosyl transferase group 1 n=1 Tax=Methyloglobulus morosus KoM1 TaxID=1116472 RepID=V5BWH2_9GAMM|nr:glycosyltransferase [Methyloglobulus morosus]ESS72209.1 glycosyl transferase group 1 [Methyloglobulus morosus KoM1]
MPRIVWINKSDWLKPGPIVYMGLLNALAFVQMGLPTDYFIGAGPDSDTNEDLADFYGQQPHDLLAIHRIKDQKRGQRRVYSVALENLAAYCSRGEKVVVLTREIGALSLLLRLKAKYPKLKVLYEAHDYYLTTRYLKKQGLSISDLRRCWSEWMLIPKTDGLICLTEHQRALYQQGFPKLPIIALPLGCLTPTKKSTLEQRRLHRRIVYIGHLHHFKGVELIFDLAGRLKHGNVQLQSFGGNADEIRSLQNKAEQEGLGEVLQFKPFISPKSLHEILDNEISLGLMPLLDTFYNRYLTCPVKALDFLAHGLPVLASDLPSTRGVLCEAGFYCSSKSVTDFARNALMLLDDPALYESASAVSYGRRDELQWQLRAQAILDFVEKG